MKCFQPMLFLIVGWAATQTKAQGCGPGDVTVVSGDAFDNRFAVRNLLTRAQQEIFGQNYWVGPDGAASFILNLGCRQTFAGIQLVNTHNGYNRDRGTKQFRLFSSQTATGPWTQVLDTQLGDSRQQQDPLPLQTIALDIQTSAQFLKLELDSWWGYGGGLQYFGIDRIIEGTQSKTCCDVLNVEGRLFPKGKYTKMKDKHYNKPVYKHEAGQFCIFFARHWKVDGCDFIRPGGDWSQGMGWSKNDPDCPGDIGSYWRYYSWGEEGSDSGPVEQDIEINCEQASPAPESSCQCGLANRRKLIVGGRDTEVNEYPWQVALVRKGDSFVFCGGSLISNQWILTAAHCHEYPASGMQALLGDHDTSIETESKAVRMDIAQIMDHPKYNFPNYDLSLLKMKKQIKFSLHPHIRPICLPENNAKDYRNSIATVTGWGRTSHGGAKPNKLQEVNVNVLSNYECRKHYPNSITDQMICTNVNGGGKNPCHGDSGGPLVTSGSGNGEIGGQNYELIGVVSWGRICASADHHAVYARVSRQLDWITAITAGTWNTCART